MQCKHCNSEWKSKEDSSISVCPFCGKSLADAEEGESKFYENSKDALAAIMKRFGADILLGKLSAHFSDLAPSVPKNQKDLVYAVYDKGASKVLKENMDGTQEDKESAVKLAVRKLTDAHIAEEAAEDIIDEFAAALGWKFDSSSGTLTGKDGKTTWTYTGGIKGRKRHGKGKCEWSNGDVYEGDWVEDEEQGKGKASEEDYVYEGDFVDGVFHGKGKKVYDDGAVYEGDFVEGNQHGKGKMIDDNGDIYEGDWVDDCMEGKGKMIYEDGEVYEGDWVKDRWHGKGKFIYINGDVYEGDFVKNNRHGKGKFTFADGDVYEGDFVNDKKHGKGKYTWSDGAIYIGDYADGERHGKGKMMYANGTVEEGEWENDEFIG